MVSFQTPVSPKEKSEISFKKRKWEGKGEEDVGQTMDRVFDIEFHLERPLPLEWQRCLDVKSGQIHFYNTRTQKKTCRDPRRSPEPLKSSPMSLELELNLPYESLEGHVDNGLTTRPDPCSPLHHSNDSSEKSGRLSKLSSLSRSLSWVNFDTDNKEMVAAVCMRCHMLVMLCKSSPACPNCKFMHPLDQNPSSLVKPSFSLLCCKD